jgi:hypothetical protein
MATTRKTEPTAAEAEGAETTEPRETGDEMEARIQAAVEAALQARDALDKTEVNPVADAITLKTLPTRGSALRLRSTRREVKMNFPICPEEQRRDEKGNMIGESCRLQLNNKRGWWDACEAAGHNPFFRHVERYREAPNWIDDPENPGAQVQRGLKRVKIRDEWVPHVKGVAWQRSVSSGQGPRNAIVRRGARRLRDAGYREVCMTSNCMQPAVFFSVRYGAYCSEKHARATAAAVAGVMYPLVNLEGVDAAHAIGDVEAQQLKSVRNYQGLDLVKGRWDESTGSIVPE